MAKYSKIGKINDDFDVVQLKSVLVKNDAGDWGNEPDNSAIGIIRSTNFNNDGKLDLTNVAYRTLSTRKFEDKKLFASDILVERSGGSETQPVGRVGYITEEIAKSDFAFANFIQRISVDETVDSKFIYYCLQHLYEMGITSGMQTQTTGIRNLDWKQYIGTYLPKPSLPEQASIANILSSVDEAIDSVKKSIEAAEKLKKSMMQNLLTGRMKPDGTLRTKEEFYEDEKFGKVPVGWEICKFGRRIIICYGKSQKEVVSENGTIPVYGTGGVIEYAIKSLCDHESVLVGRKGTIDKPCFINIPFWAVDTTYYVDSFIDGNMKYLYYMLLRMNLKTLNEATGVPSITRRTINRQKVLLPPLTEQNAIVETLEKIEEQINNKQTQITTLLRLKKSLMQNLLTGKVRVKK